MPEWNIEPQVYKYHEPETCSNCRHKPIPCIGCVVEDTLTCRKNHKIPIKKCYNAVRCGDFEPMPKAYQKSGSVDKEAKIPKP